MISKGGHGRLTAVLAVLVMACTGPFLQKAAAEKPPEAGAPEGTGRITIESVEVRAGRWISIGETSFHPDQTLLPGGPTRKSRSSRPGEVPAKGPGVEPAGAVPPPEIRLNRVKPRFNPVRRPAG